MFAMIGFFLPFRALKQLFVSLLITYSIFLAVNLTVAILVQTSKTGQLDEAIGVPVEVAEMLSEIACGMIRVVYREDSNAGTPSLSGNICDLLDGIASVATFPLRFLSKSVHALGYMTKFDLLPHGSVSGTILWSHNRVIQLLHASVTLVDHTFAAPVSTFASAVEQLLQYSHSDTSSL